MTILTIARMGHPILTYTADEVVDPTDSAVARLAADMLETMGAAGGIGLAAPQVRVSLQVVLFRVPGERTEDGAGLGLTTLINPEITPLDEALEEGPEACLSVPGLVGLVPRWRHIGYRGYGLDGKLIEREAKGFHARVVQHECDHLWGRLYLSRMNNLTSLAFTDELRLLAEERGLDTGEEREE